MKQINKLKFIREPGFICDLIYIFVYRFNKQYCLSNYINTNKFDEDINLLNSVMHEYKNISDDLLLFFHLKDHGKCFFSEYYFESEKENFVSDYDFTYIQSLLFDDERIIQDVFEYYFSDVTEFSDRRQIKYISIISELIDKSEYSDNIKLKLYSFFLNPKPIIRKLKYELISINNSLTQYYEKHYKIIADFQNSIKLENLSNSLKQIGNHSFNIMDYTQIFISPCLMTKNCIKYFYYDDYIVILLGYDYYDVISYILSKKEPIVLNEIANALSEKNRVDILDFILKKEEVSIRDLENELNISGTNAYYHITMMVKVNILIARNQGKTVLYSLNKNFFDLIIVHLKKYSNNWRS